MKIASLLPVLLLVLVRTNCHPLLEDELVGNGNSLDDAFLDDAVFPSLLDPINMGRLDARLSPFLQPPTIEFQAASFPGGDDAALVESKKFSKNPLPDVLVLLPPSMVMEPPTREFVLNLKKGVTDGHLSPERFLAAHQDTLLSAASQELGASVINQTKDKPTKKEGRATEIEEPSRILLPPTKEFFVAIPRSLVPPTEEFIADGSK